MATTEIVLTLKRVSAKNPEAEAETGGEGGYTLAWDGNTYTFSHLAQYDAEGYAYTYSVEEAVAEGVTGTFETRTDESGLNFTNLRVGEVEVSGTKTWLDGSETHEDNANEIDSRAVTAGTNWSYAFQHLPVDDGYGNIYNYEIREDGVSGYFSRIDGTTVTNSLIDGNVPPTPTADGENPPPDEGVPAVPEKPEDVPKRRTGTPVPRFENMGDEELEGILDMFGYGTPLYGMFGTGDTVPAWVWICSSCGLLALALVILLGKRKRRTN